MKKGMNIRKHTDTYPGDDLYSIQLELTEMTARETVVAMAAIEQRVYPLINKVVYASTKKHCHYEKTITTCCADERTKSDCPYHVVSQKENTN